MGAMEGVWHEASDIRTERAGPPRDVAIAGVAEQQYGVVSLHRIHRGVYAVGHPRLTTPGRWMAAVLACGPEAVLSHRSAAALWGLLEEQRARADVTLPRSSIRARPRVAVHAGATLATCDVTRQEEIPCTSVARTLLDLAAVVRGRQLERAVEQAEVLRLFDLRAVEDALRRANGHHGAGVLRAVLADLKEPALTASDTEERFLALCATASLPRPEVNVWMNIDDGTPIKVDFLWRRERLAVETDAFGTHGTKQAFERDRCRDQRLHLAGWEPLRFTLRQMIREPSPVTATLATLLSRRAARVAAR